METITVKEICKRIAKHHAERTKAKWDAKGNLVVGKPEINFLGPIDKNLEKVFPSIVAVFSQLGIDIELENANEAESARQL